MFTPVDLYWEGDFFGVIKTSLWKEWKTMVNSRAGNRGEKMMLFQDLHVVQLDQDTEGKM